MSGSLDDMAVYNVALSQSRVQAHYAAGTGTSLSSYKQAVLSDPAIWREEVR